MSEAREKLLQAVIAELDRSGLRDRSLREIAEAAGTSHRMLIHHFGSREGMLVAVVEQVEADERAAALGRYAPADIDPAEELRATWRRLSDPAVAGRERLFFECYARALAGESPFSRLLPGAVDHWVSALSATDVARGVPPRVARARSRFVLAFLRGLLLDLLATGDRQGTTDAVEALLALAGASPPPPDSHSPQAPSWSDCPRSPERARENSGGAAGLPSSPGPPHRVSAPPRPALRRGRTRGGRRR